MSYLFELKKNNLKEIPEKDFSLEKDIQNVIENNVEELFNLKLIKSEFTINNYRLDSLCFDEENKSFVIIEYKKHQSYSVIDQGYSYLSALLNNKSDFILEFNENMDKPIKRDEVDWSQSKIIFVSPDFSTYQKDSINFKDIPFELWEIKQFSNNFISFNKLISDSKESVNKVTKKSNSLIGSVSKEIKVYSEEDLLKNREKTRELYEPLKEELLKIQGAELVPGRSYVTLRRNNKIIAYINIRTNNLKIDIVRRVDFSGNVTSKKISYTIEDPKKLFSLNRRKDNRSEGYTYQMKDKKDFNFLILVLKHAFENKN